MTSLTSGFFDARIFGEAFTEGVVIRKVAKKHTSRELLTMVSMLIN